MRGASFETGKVENDGVIRGERDPAARGIGVKCHHTRQHERAMRPTLLKLDCHTVKQ